MAEWKSAAKVRCRKVKWLDPKRIPSGKVTVIVLIQCRGLLQVAQYKAALNRPAERGRGSWAGSGLRMTGDAGPLLLKRCACPPGRWRVLRCGLSSRRTVGGRSPRSPKGSHI